MRYEITAFRLCIVSPPIPAWLRHSFLIVTPTYNLIIQLQLQFWQMTPHSHVTQMMSQTLISYSAHFLVQILLRYLLYRYFHTSTDCTWSWDFVLLLILVTFELCPFTRSRSTWVFAISLVILIVNSHAQTSSCDVNIFNFKSTLLHID